MNIVIDKETTSDAGYNTYLSRDLFTSSDQNTMIGTRYTDASSLVGGIIGSEGVLYLGSKQIKLDGKNRRITIEDGINDRILIGGF